MIHYGPATPSKPVSVLLCASFTARTVNLTQHIRDFRTLDHGSLVYLEILSGALRKMIQFHLISLNKKTLHIPLCGNCAIKCMQVYFTIPIPTKKSVLCEISFVCIFIHTEGRLSSSGLKKISSKKYQKSIGSKVRLVLH